MSSAGDGQRRSCKVFIVSIKHGSKKLPGITIVLRPIIDFRLLQVCSGNCRAIGNASINGYSGNAKPVMSCFNPSAAPMKIAIKAAGALKARTEKAEMPWPTLHPTARMAPGPIIAAPNI